MDIFNLEIKSDAFEDGGTIPVAYTGRGEDKSPGFQLASTSPDGKSIAIIMDDLDHTLLGIYNHWVIWNIPIMEEIPEAIPKGAIVNALGGAIQGKGYGRHKYRGPKPPFGASHKYQFNIYILDEMLDLDSSSRKKELLDTMEGHVVQSGAIVGRYK